MRWVVRTFGILVALGAPASAQRAASYSDKVKSFIVADQPDILVRNARLWDGTGATAREGVDMLVRDGRIAAIGRKLPAPTDAKVIDALGKTLMPGLVMMHEHLDREPSELRTMPYTMKSVPQIMLAYGTTSARTAGSLDSEGDVAIKKWIRAGRLAGPDLDLSVAINGPVDLLTVARIDGPADARREIAYWNARGMTSVKLFFDTTPEIAAAAIDEARRRNMPVAAHLCATHAKTAARLGLDSLEHSLLTAYDLVPSAKEGQCSFEDQTKMIQQMATLDPNGPEVGALLTVMLENGVAIDPTIVGRDLGFCIPKPKPGPRELALLDAFDPNPTYGCSEGLSVDIDRRSIAFQAATAVRYQRMGGRLIMGTDRGVVHGASGPSELEHMVAAGLSPSEVLVAATRNGAIVMRRDKDIGTLEVGKRADFLLVDGKPDIAISDIRKLTYVARDGIVYDPEKLYQDAKGKLN